MKLNFQLTQYSKDEIKKKLIKKVKLVKPANQANHLNL